MIHLLPSSSIRGGFLVRILSGLGRLPGTGDLPPLDCESERVGGTAAPARREGFLCVCCEGSTLRRPAVTASPFESWSNTAPMSEVGRRDVLVPLTGIGGGGGGPFRAGIGGGGGAGGFEDEGTALIDLVSPDCTWRSASCGSIPSLLFHVTPDG